MYHADYGAKQEPDYRDLAPSLFPLPLHTAGRADDGVGPVLHPPRAGVLQRSGVRHQNGIGCRRGRESSRRLVALVEITKIVDTDKYIATVHLHFRSAGKMVPRVRLDLQFAPEPGDQSGQTLHEDLDGDTVTLLVPGRGPPNF